jgi:hypothetical protein
MPKFHYKVELTDGTIATRKSFREYTHLIEISPQPIEGYIADCNKSIAQEWERWKSYNKTPEEIEEIIRVQDLNDTIRIRNYNHLSDADKVAQITSTMESNRKWNSVERYADSRKDIEARIKKYEERRDKAIADGHPTVGNYFASNWCGSLSLAVKKKMSRDVRYWTDRGHTARIVSTPLGQ